MHHATCRAAAVAAFVIGASAPASAQLIRIFEVNPSTGMSVTWTATSNLGPLQGTLQAYSFFGNVVVEIDPTPALDIGRIESARLRIPNTVSASLTTGPQGTVAWRDLVLDASSPDFTVVPGFPFSTFSTTIDLRISSGFVEVSPPFGPAFIVPLNGTSLGSSSVTGAFPTVGPAQGLRVDGFSFDMGVTSPGWNVTFTHDVASLDATLRCPSPIPYCFSDPAAPGGGTTLALIGSASVLLDGGFTLDVAGAPANSFGVFFYGQDAAELPSGFGRICVGGPLTRLGTVPTSGTGTAGLRVPLAQLQLGPAALAPGTHRSFQFWHRANGPIGPSWNLSNALAVTFCP